MGDTDIRSSRELALSVREKAIKILSSLDREELMDTVLSLMEKDHGALRDFVATHTPKDDISAVYELALSDIRAGFYEYEPPSMSDSDWDDEEEDDDDEDWSIMYEVISRMEKHVSSFKNGGNFTEAFSIVLDTFLMLYDEEVSKSWMEWFAEKAGALWNEIFCVSFRDDKEANDRIFSLFREKSMSFISDKPLITMTMWDAAADGFQDPDHIETMISGLQSLLSETDRNDRDRLERLTGHFIKLSKKLGKDSASMLPVLEALPDGITKAENMRVELYDEEGRWSDALSLIERMLKERRRIGYDNVLSLLRKEIDILRKSGDLERYEAKVKALMSARGYDKKTVKDFLIDITANPVFLACRMINRTRLIASLCFFKA